MYLVNRVGQSAFIRDKMFKKLTTNHLLSSRNLFMKRLYCDQINRNNNSSRDSGDATSSSKITQPILDSKYTLFQEADAPVLLDVFEEKLQLQNEVVNIDDEEDTYYGLNLERGVQGVFDIEDLVELLRRDKAENVFVAVLPPEARYVDHIVIVNGRSRKHMNALAAIVRRVFKKKRFSTDILPRIEGENSADWMALDLGNIALHIFSRNARNVYDLESLWSVGAEYDPLANKPDDPLIALLKKHAISLNEMNSKGELL